MMMTQLVNPKIEKVLNKLLEPNFKPKDDRYLNSLLAYLTSISDKKVAVYQQEANKKILIHWIKQAISYWDETKTIGSVIVLTFVLNLMGYLSRDEHTFLDMNNDSMYERMLAMIMSSFEYSGTQPSIEQAYIRVYSSLLNHASGLQWIMANERWQRIMKYFLHPSNISISEEGNEFMASLLERITKVDPVNVKNILHVILMPLLHAGSIQTKKDAVMTLKNEEEYESIVPLLPVVAKVLEILMESTNQDNMKEIILMLEDDFNFHKNLKILTAFIKEEDLSNLYKIYIIWCFSIVYIKYGDESVVFYEKIEKQLLGIFYDATSQLNVIDILKLLHFSHIYWNKMRSKILPTPDNSSEKSLEKQLLILQIFPVCAVWKNENLEDDHGRFLCLQKFYDQIPPHTLRVRYKWKMHLKEASFFNNEIMALKYFLHSKKYYFQENVTLAFQCMIYIVKDITNILTERHDLIHAFLNQPDFIIHLLECMKVIVDEFTITWKDSVESLCVLQVTHAFINITTWPSKIIISCLQLIEKALAKYMTPEMALLMDTTEESSLYHTLSTLRTKLHDSDWEVRNSAIELIRTITVSTYTRFSSLGKMLMMNDFPTSILQMATIDGNSYVRATSLKCLQEMVKVKEFWDALINKGQILGLGTRILYVEQEGIVQTEAAALIDSIYNNHELPESTLSNLYEIMHHTVIAGSHWKIRENALKFWKNVIDKHLTQQGMIDEDFPTFVFSKEMHKIIKLTMIQVKTRLIKVLEQLSQIGCLSAFRFALEDDCDLEVIKYATIAMTEFATLLKKYKISTSDVSSQSPVSRAIYKMPRSDSPETRPSMGSKDNTKYNSYLSSDSSGMDEVLDYLDDNLLESIFSSLDEPSNDDIEMQSPKIVPLKEFLESVYSDLAYRMKQKSKWIGGIDSFDSLLDNILKEYQVNEVCEMDCY